MDKITQENFEQAHEAFMEMATALQGVAVQLNAALEPALVAINKLGVEIWRIVWAEYIADGAIYGEDMEGIKRWLDEMWQQIELQAQIDTIKIHQAAMRPKKNQEPAWPCQHLWEKAYEQETGSLTAWNCGKCGTTIYGPAGATPDGVAVCVHSWKMGNENEPALLRCRGCGKVQLLQPTAVEVNDEK